MKDIPGFEGRYAVDEEGNVYSYRAGRFLRPGRMQSGHMSVALGRGNSRCVHELVLITYEGPRPHGHEARHLDGDPANNRRSNLQWSTRSRNSQDKKWHRGGRNYKLTGEQAAEFKRRLLAGEPRKALCARFGVSKSTGDAIAQGVFHRDA